MFKYVPAVLASIVLGACAPEEMDSGVALLSYPQELWTCNHNESRYSAYVEAQTVDTEEWTRIEFFIHDHDSSYEMEMRLGKDGVWRSNGNLYDLDCNSSNLGAMFAYYEL